MTIDDCAAGDRRPEALPHSHLSTLRLWRELAVDGWNHRGIARDVATGAFRAFQHGSDLTAFMIGRGDGASEPVESTKGTSG